MELFKHRIASLADGARPSVFKGGYPSLREVQKRTRELKPKVRFRKDSSFESLLEGFFQMPLASQP